MTKIKIKEILKNTFKNCLNENFAILSDRQFSLLSPEAKRDYAVTMANKGYGLSDAKFSLLSPEAKRDHAVAMGNEGYGISTRKFNLLSPESKRDYAVAMANEGYNITDVQFSLLSQEGKEEYFYIKKMIRLFSNNKTALEKFQALMREKYKLNV